ncbi:MAG: DNA polymerase III subunit beta [Patescibacteria group bacterium]|mgnify:CR=1 FL=1
MKLAVLQEDLAKSLITTSRFVNTRAQLPILGNIILKTEKTSLRLLATNLENSISMSLGAKVEAEGEIAVPAKTISEIVSNLARGQVELEAQKEHLKIKTDSFTGTVSGMNTSDFPKIEDIIGKNAVIFKKLDFNKAISKVLFCASVDETRPVITGVLFLNKNEKLYVVATDGFRLSQKILNLPKGVSFEKVILPRNFVSELLHIGESDNFSFEIKEKESQAIFEIDNIVLTSRLISGSYPNFENIIPKEAKTKVRVGKEELLRATKLASVFARESANMVKVKVLKDSLKISAESGKSGSQEGSIEAKVEGEEVEIVFNYRFIEEFLNVVEGEEVEIQLSNTTSPGVFLDPKDPDFLHLIMPVKVQS